MGRMSDMALEAEESRYDDYDFYATLAGNRKMAFEYRASLEAAWPPGHRTPEQSAEIQYARNICDIAREA